MIACAALPPAVPERVTVLPETLAMQQLLPDAHTVIVNNDMSICYAQPRQPVVDQIGLLFNAVVKINGLV